MAARAASESDSDSSSTTSSGSSSDSDSDEDEAAVAVGAAVEPAAEEQEAEEDKAVGETVGETVEETTPRKVCQYFLSGKCRNARCKFAHTQDGAKNGPPPPRQPRVPQAKKANAFQRPSMLGAVSYTSECSDNSFWLDPSIILSRNCHKASDSSLLTTC